MLARMQVALSPCALCSRNMRGSKILQTMLSSRQVTSIIARSTYTHLIHLAGYRHQLLAQAARVTRPIIWAHELNMAVSSLGSALALIRRKPHSSQFKMVGPALKALQGPSHTMRTPGNLAAPLSSLGNRWRKVASVTLSTSPSTS